MTTILFRGLLLWCFTGWMPSVIYACECQPRKEIGVADWNDTPLIFKAELIHYKKTFQYAAMTFRVTEQYKGSLPTDSLRIYYQPYKSPTLMRAVKDFSPGNSWIVFAKATHRSQRTHYHLLDSENGQHCALSRPLKKKRRPLPPFSGKHDGNSPRIPPVS